MQLDKFQAAQVKDTLADRLIDVFSEEGLPGLRKQIARLMQRCTSSEYPVDYRNQIKGECTEVLLQAMLINLQQSLNSSVAKESADRFIPSLSIKGLCFTSSGTMETTEMDITFFTPYAIYAFECKCYTGPKTLTGNGLLKGKFNEVDVSSQSYKHINFLNSRIGQFHKGALSKRTNDKYPPYKMILVDGSWGECKDLRELPQRQILPLLTMDNMEQWLLNDIAERMKHRIVHWDIASLRPTLLDLKQKSDAMFQMHLKSSEGWKKNEK